MPQKWPKWGKIENFEFFWNFFKILIFYWFGVKNSKNMRNNGKKCAKKRKKMQKYAQNMRKYAQNMRKYAQNQKNWKYVQICAAHIPPLWNMGLPRHVCRKGRPHKGRCRWRLRGGGLKTRSPEVGGVGVGVAAPHSAVPAVSREQKPHRRGATLGPGHMVTRSGWLVAWDWGQSEGG